MQNKISLLIIFIATILCGCQNSQVDQQLDHVESIMEERPDSALTILQQIDGTTLHGEPQARHALLLSQAYDKNYIDLTSDSLISIATSYYNKAGDKHHRLMTGYYKVVILMNRREFDEALSDALDVESLAEDSGDLAYLARTRLIIARAYMFSFNQEGAKEYFDKSLSTLQQLDNAEWIGLTLINLSNWALHQKEYQLAIEYADSAKFYIPGNKDIPEYEMLALVGLQKYKEADSLYTHHIPNPSIQANAYKLLVDFQLGKRHHVEDSLSSLLSAASHFDSIDIAYISSHIDRLCGDYEQALNHSQSLLQESDNVIKGLSTHSLYRIQLEYEKLKQLEAENNLRTQHLLLSFACFVVVLIIFFGIIYFRLISKQHKVQMSAAKNEIALISSDFAEIQAKFKQESDQQKHKATLLNEQLLSGRIAAQELFMSKYAWIEEFGNIFIDAEITHTSASRALKELRERLDAVKTKDFILNLKAVINRYFDNLMVRVSRECPSITESEQTILALLCANLSPRIISFILNIQPQSVYNAKSSVKRKLEHNSPALLQEIKGICA